MARFAAVLMVICGATSVYAQPGNQPPSEPAEPAEPPPPPPAMAPPPSAMPAQGQPGPASSVDPGVRDDANAGRGWLSPTALTEPGGTWSISDYELFLVSIGYAVNDQLSISATTIPPLTEDFPLWLLLSGKVQIAKIGRVRAALQGAVTYFTSNDSSNDSFTAADLGGALTLCLDDGCNSHLSGFVGAGFARDTDSSVPFLGAATLVARLGRHVKLVGEVDSAFIAGQVNDVADGALIWYGLRFTSSMIGVDVGFVRPIGVDDSGLVLGIPVLTFSYRNID
ncbi:MAG TPA: hypothetical protein VFK02_21405 [Kofleriaceae bacterium]|nr:hypothetical protein [Kofleriaceae bacterium]